MMPHIGHTHIPVPTQVSLVATPLPGTSALRVLPDAVAPTVSDAALGPDYKGNGGYASAPASQATAASPAPILSTLMPASFSTANATLSASAMFATQLMSQDAPGGTQLFAVYEELVAASQVKYMPSNATMPEPATNSLFAKMLAETQTQNNVRVSVQVQQAPKEAVAQAAAPLATLKFSPAVTKQKANVQAAHVAAARTASHAYQTTSVRNKTELEAAEPVDAVTG